MSRPVSALGAICGLAVALAGCGSAWAEGEPPQPVKALVVTADDEQASGTIIGLKDGQLQLDGPARSIPLSDILRVDLGGSAEAAALTGELNWIGQDNHDLVQVGSASGGNGIQDIHLHATALKPVAIKQIIVTCRFPKQLRVWRLDTSQSPHWRIAMARAELAGEAELYLEPAAQDAFAQSFEVTYTYNDGSTHKASIAATTHTSDQRRLDRAAQPGQVAGASDAGQARAELYLADGGRLRGELASLDSESLTLNAPWKAQVLVPLVHAKGFWFGNPATPEGALVDFEKQLAAPAAEDTVFVLSPDKSLATIQAALQGLSDGKLKVRYQDTARAINQERALGLVFAAHPPLTPPVGLTAVLMFPSGERLSGQWVGFANGALELETPWKSRVSIPAERLAQIRMLNGKLTFLSDLEPIAVEEVAYFGRVISWRRDEGFDGQPPKLRGKQPARSLAMHSRSALTYAIDGAYEKFKATVGFDDTAGQRGRVDCRVLVDGREAFAKTDFRSNQDPLPIEIPLVGAKQLRLEVDFGPEEDIGDRILWAEPRLFRATASEPSAR